LSTRVTSFDQAVKEGAIALFGEKYGDEVRVVTVPGFSAELCGGTHLDSTGQIGLFLIISESSIGSGLRRIEALTGRGAEAYVRERLDALHKVGDMLSATQGDEAKRVAALVEQLHEERRQVQDLRRQIASHSVETLLDQAVEIAGTKVLAMQVEANDLDTLREMCDGFRNKLGSAVVALGAVIDDRPLLVVALTQDLIAKGLHAGKLAGSAAKRMGGGGGGKPSMAQAGGKDVAHLPQALRTVPEMVAKALNE